MSNDMKYPDDYDIGWEKWIDAYDQQLEIEDELDDNDDEDDNDDKDDIINDENSIELNKLFGGASYMPLIKSIMTPYGILPLTEQSLASKHFKFWVGHTNFMLGDGTKTSVQDFERLIGGTLGVESVDILTPLRFRISIGKMFKDREVMDKVKNILIAFVRKTYDNQEKS